MTMVLKEYISEKIVGSRVSFFYEDNLITGTLESVQPLFSVKLTEVCKKRLNLERFCIQYGELADVRLMTVGEGRR